ncbi:hypothetical protein NA57DRAFT_41610 [Rhizodiscina lignyota]|uniref:GPI ethanolamine phosphate transferase 3 n=1 Tax=Rhizodiscina lignyota TaxID=1504668 RepID=A0A9P4M4A5_9PEZI|nr:hypothetical protein NA57DRAFT_41610 [Rhizodiscina lignyota]
MDDGVQTEYTGIAAEFAKARAERDKEEAKGLRDSSVNAKAFNKQKEIEFSASHALLIAFFCLLLFLQLLGVYLFASGFLLTRLVLDHKSKCDVPPVPLDQSTSLSTSEHGCWHPKTFDRAVIILIDALRYDFTVPYLSSDPHHYHNTLKILHEISVQQPNNAFLLPFIADPPTTTLQRLKALTTGTLPTFIDAGSNFAGTAIDEDNLIAQLLNASKTVVHLGDDTWHSLFPGYFDANLTKPYDSFNVWDLHTVDNGVSKHIFPLLDPKNSSKWDVIIGHYLGVDHAGHRYGPDHPAMTAKLEQMDDVFRRLIATVDDDTLLVILGDHGMDSKGDHGGESDDEVEAALWMYSKKGIFGRSDPSFVEPPRTAKERPVAQIDLVPTLALLLGLPIPFNNLGKPIEEAFIGSSGKNYENVARVHRLAAAQIHRYMNEYKQVRGLDSGAFGGADSMWDKATSTWATLGSLKSVVSKPWTDIAKEFGEYQRQTLQTCRDLWARFDLISMLHGVEILLASLIALIVYGCAIDGDTTELSPLLVARGFIGTAAGAAVGSALAFSVSTLPAIHTTVYCTAVGGLIGIGSAYWYARRRLTVPLPKSLWSWTAVTLTLLLSIGFASNSYTIWEDQTLLVFVATFGILMLASSIGQQSLTNRALGCYHSVLFIILTRAASFSRLCREEQMPHCRSSYYASASSSTSAVWTLLIPFALSFLLPSIVKSYYDTTQSYQGSAVLWIGSAFRIGLVLTAMFWSLDAADDNDWLDMNKDTLKTIKTFVAQTVLAIAFAAGHSLFGYASPFLNIRTNSSDDSNPTDEAIASDSGSSAISIQGYNNVHGTRYFILLTIWGLGIILLQKPLGGGVIGILVWQILCLLEIIAANPSLRSTAVGPIVLALLGSYHFFKTGHAATFSSIQWDTAFIPLKTVRYPWSPIVIVLNSLGAQILCAIAVPLTQLWKVPPRKQGLMGSVTRAMTQHFLFYAVIGLATTLWAGHLRRHLMLYRVFMPRFLMATVVGAVVQVVGIFVGIGGLRWTFLSVGEVFGWT